MTTSVIKFQHRDLPNENVLVSIIPIEIKGFLQDEDLPF
jgi:hypothetical protein